MNTSLKTFKRIFTFAQLILIAFTVTSVIKAQTSGVDLSFNAVLSKDADGGNFTLQPDGKILVFGGFQIVNGVIKNQIARLNADGSLDNSFDCAACDFSIGSAVVQADGKIVVAGSLYSAATQTNVARIRRLNVDGSLDNSFAAPLGEPSAQVNSFAYVWAVQPDGKVLVEITSRSAGSSASQKGIYRLNANGSFDNTFTTINIFQGILSRDSVSKLAITADGKILISRNNSNGRGFLNRYNSDGTSDTTFESPILTGDPDVGNTSSRISDFDIQPDGKIVIGGLFTAVNSISRKNVVGLMPAGNVDLSFAPASVFMRAEPANQIKILSNGQILISTGTGFPTAFPPPASGNRFFRFNADGSLDNTFASPANLVQIVKWEVDASDRVLVYGGFLENGITVFKFARLNPNGSVSVFLNAYFGIGGSVLTLAVQPDGKVLFAGDFSRVNDVPRRKLARVNADGTSDSTFNPGVGIDNPITKIVVEPDGKILLGGSFTVNNLSGLGIVRLNSDGSLDTVFNPILGITVYSIVLQADGKILVGGSFTGVNGQTRVGLVRLNSDGTTDASFNPAFGTGTVIRSIAVQADGKIMVGGAFNAVNGFARNNLVRLNADGSLDTVFNAGSISQINQIEILPDGKYLVLTNTLVRLNANGTADAAFQSPSLTGGAINAFLVLPDGTIIVGGSFTAVNNTARSRLARLRPDGSSDGTFFPSGANNQINAIVRQTDGRIIVGGSFTSIENVTRLGIARLNVGPVRAPLTPYDFDGDGRADIAVFRPSNGFWYQLRSQNNTFAAVQFGQQTDRIAPGDYDGDGKADVAVFRDVVAGAGNFAYFYILNSADNSFRPVQFGATGDVPVTGDWDADGKSDLAVYREGSPTGGQSFFYYRPSSQPGVDFRAIAWGGANDKPLVGDFDGDGRLDPAVFRPSTAAWYILRSSNNQVLQTNFGVSTDIPVPADFDGDGVTNIAVFRPSSGTWFTSTNPQNNYGAIRFGTNGDLPVPADYDGDGKADVAVFRPSNGSWYLNRSTQGFAGTQFGISEDLPIPNAFVR